jgi:DNA-directed RNA polymerase subunit RPC12/RpoP
MIIACPDCSGPYQLPDDQVAALVQIECPHCTSRIILDFEAANTPALVEPGMGVANSWASEAEYRAAIAGAAAATAAAPSPPSTPPQAPPTTQAPAPAAAPGPVRSTRPEPPSRPGAEGRTEADEVEGASETGRTLLGQPPLSIPPVPPEQRARTPQPLELTDRIAQQRAAHEARVSPPVELTHLAPASLPEPEPEPEREPEPEPDGLEEQEAAYEPEPRIPPHTPPAQVAASTPPRRETVPEAGEEPEEEAPSPAELSASLASSDVELERPSHALLYLLVGSLFVVVTLAGLAFYETGDPNPLPLIEEIVRGYTG